MNIAFPLEIDDKQEAWRRDPREYNATSSVISSGLESDSADDLFCPGGTPNPGIHWWILYDSPIPESAIVRFYEEIIDFKA